MIDDNRAFVYPSRGYSTTPTNPWMLTKNGCLVLSADQIETGTDIATLFFMLHKAEPKRQGLDLSSFGRSERQSGSASSTFRSKIQALARGRKRQSSRGSQLATSSLQQGYQVRVHQAQGSPKSDASTKHGLFRPMNEADKMRVHASPRFWEQFSAGRTNALN